jgi:hypothetical protein
MGLFGIFKKKEEPKRQNSVNSVYSLNFTIPYFSIFDRTDKTLAAFPVKLAVAGSVQYRIVEPTLCFDNVPLAEMSAEQLQSFVGDNLIATVKAFILSISTIPLMQFESAIGKINEAAKAKLVPSFQDEFGISLRAFSISRFTYDEEDPNYLQLMAASRDAFARRNARDSQREDLDFKRENEDIEEERERARRERERAERDATRDFREREREERLKDAETEYSIETRHQDIEFHKREREEDLYARRKATDMGSTLTSSLSSTDSKDSSGDDFSLPEDDSFKIEGL